MTPLVWANFPLALLFLLARAGHPLRMTLRHPGTVPDLAAAHACPAAKVALATGGEPETDCRRSLEQHRTDRRRTTRRPGGRQDDPRASQPARRKDYCDQRCRRPMTDLAARAVRPGRIPAKASCRPEDHRLPSADGTDDGDRHRGRRQADGQMRSSRRPQGSSLAPASGQGAQVPHGSLAVQFKLRAGQTAGRLSITKITLDPHRLAPPHVHADKDEYTDVAAGTIGVRVADEECEAAQGCYLVKPRDVAHAFWNPTDKLARTVEVIAPAGFEAFFEELAAACGDARQTQQRRADLAAKYRLGYFTELVPALKAKHRLKLIGE